MAKKIKGLEQCVKVQRETRNDEDDDDQMGNESRSKNKERKVQNEVFCFLDDKLHFSIKRND